MSAFSREYTYFCNSNLQARGSQLKALQMAP